MKCECGNEDLLYLSKIEEPLKIKGTKIVGVILINLSFVIYIIGSCISNEHIKIIGLSLFIITIEATARIINKKKTKTKVKCMCKKCDKIITIEAKE